jgi:DNA-binding NarL/FixJ family response regulator
MIRYVAGLVEAMGSTKFPRERSAVGSTVERRGGKMEPISVAIFDGNTLVREGLKRVLAAERDLNFVGETGDDDEVAHMVERTSPDVLLLDLEVAQQKTVQILLGLKKKDIRTKVLILCSFPDLESILDTAKVGARGFILKRTLPSVLIQAIRKIHGGEIWADRQVNCADTFVEIARQTDIEDAGRSESDITEVVSKRELEILTLVSKGLTNAEIAKKLFVSPQTVKQHLHHVFDKLNVKNRTQAALLMQEKHREKF